MLKQLKEFRQESDNARKAAEALRDEIHSLRQQLHEEKEELLEIKNLQVDFLNQFKQNVTALKELHEGISRELQQFKALSNRVGHVLVEKTEKELASVTAHATQVLHTDVERQRALKADVDATAKNLLGLNQRIAELAEIAKEIKKTDFALTDYIKAMRKETSENARLAQENEELKRMMAKMKRARQ